MTALQAHESEHGPITLAPESAAAAPTAAPAGDAGGPATPAAPAGSRPGLTPAPAPDGADALGRTGQAVRAATGRGAVADPGRGVRLSSSPRGGAVW